MIKVARGERKRCVCVGLMGFGCRWRQRRPMLLLLLVVLYVVTYMRERKREREDERWLGVLIRIGFFANVDVSFFFFFLTKILLDMIHF